MGLETASYINDLNTSNPASTDQQSQGDDHLRLLKSVLKATFPNASKTFRFATSVVRTGNYTLVFPDDHNSIQQFNATSGNLTVTLPAVSGVDAVAWGCYIAKVDGTANTVTISGGTINDTTSFVLRKAFQGVFLFHLSGKWIAIEMGKEFPATTAMLFYQAAAPSGWTKSTANDDKALRVVSGSGGVAGGTTAFSTVMAARTILQENLPDVNFTVTDPGHTHVYTKPIQSATNHGTNAIINQLVLDPAAETDSATTGITVSSGGSDTALDFDIQYVDVIIATKD